MGMAVILFNEAEPFEQIVHILSTEGPMWNLVKLFLRRRHLKVLHFIHV